MDEWLLKTQNADVVVVDLDGTLIFTNQSNLLAYQAATFEVIGKYLPERAVYYDRLTRNRLSEVLDDQSTEVLDAIALRKEVIYAQFLHNSQLNTKLYQFLNSSHCQLVLATNARQARAEQLLHHHHLYPLFSECYYYDEAQPNKFKNIFNRFKDKEVIIFENETAQAALALAAGADPKNIIMVNAL